MFDSKKVINDLRDCRRYLEDKEWSDKTAGQYIEVLNNAIETITEQKKQINGLFEKYVHLMPQHKRSIQK